jgi:hypothetical protein
MNKCDFCDDYNPASRRCCGSVGGYYCGKAAERFLSFMKGNRTQTKNINIHKTKKNYNKHR